MVFFNMLNDVKNIKKTMKKMRKNKSHTTIRKNKRKNIKKKMKGGNGCEITGLLTEPALNIPSRVTGQNTGLNIKKTLAKIN